MYEILKQEPIVSSDGKTDSYKIGEICPKKTFFTYDDNNCLTKAIEIFGDNYGTIDFLKEE